MKTIWIIVIVAVVLLIIYFVYQNMNKNKTTIVMNGARTTNTVVPEVRRTEQVFNPYPQEYLNSFPNPELIRVK